ncbi:MAG: hypothetical protein ACK5DD_03005 [Cyclobacteriaceae bacterium]
MKLSEQELAQILKTQDRNQANRKATPAGGRKKLNRLRESRITDSSTQLLSKKTTPIFEPVGEKDEGGIIMTSLSAGAADKSATCTCGLTAKASTGPKTNASAIKHKNNLAFR